MWKLVLLGERGSREYNGVKKKVKVRTIYSLQHLKCKFDISSDVHLYVPGTYHICGVFVRIPRAEEGA